MKNFKPLFFLFVILLAGLPLFADKGAIPGRDYSVFVGLGEQPVVSGNETKEKIDRLPPVPQVKEAAPVEESIDLTNAVILKQIQKAKKPASQTQKGGDLITLPAKFEKEMSQYYATLAEKAAASAAVPVPSAEQLLLLQFKTFKDYKINNNTNMKMICHKPNDKSVSYKLSANLAVAERELV
ncbi:MAG: hypothetical protein QG560_1186, partial [Campylobacterota bacterium]|nr:hypothetical protein [Campylobacterota bacterium]